MTGDKLERGQDALRVRDDGYIVDIQCRNDIVEPFADLLNRLQWRALGMCMAGKVERQDRIIPEGEKARLQTPEGVVEAASTKENDTGLAVVKRFATG